jgi:preprotein translocase subunit YajC
MPSTTTVSTPSAPWFLSAVPGTLAVQDAAAAPAAPRTVEIPGLPAQAAPAAQSATTGQPGSAQPVPATPAPRSGTGDLTFLFLLTGFMVLLIVMSVFSGRKEKKRRQELLSALAPNDRVQTIGGILGTIVEIRDDEVVLRVDENTNTRIRFSKSAVQQVLRKSGTHAKTEAEAKPDRAKAIA